MMKVIFHIDQSENWQMTVNNVSNLLKYLKEVQESCVIEILANGKAVAELKEEFAKEAEFYDKFKELAENKVDIVACRNALNNSKIEEKDLFSFVRVVPAGVVELIVKQKEGFAYIRP